MTTTTITTYAPCEYCKGEGRKLLRRFDPLLAYEKCPACNGERRVVVKVEKFEADAIAKRLCSLKEITWAQKLWVLGEGFTLSSAQRHYSAASTS